MTVPLYVPAAWLAAGRDGAADPDEQRAGAAEGARRSRPADGVKAVQPAVVLVGLVQPVQLPIGRLLAPLVRLAGQRERQVDVGAGLTGEVEPAAGRRRRRRSVLLTPGKTVPKSSVRAPVTVIAWIDRRGGGDVGALGLGRRSGQAQECGQDGRYSDSGAHCPSLSVGNVVVSDCTVPGSASSLAGGRATYVPRVKSAAKTRGKSFQISDFKVYISCTP